MKKYNKKEAIKIITDAAKCYRDNLMNSRFLLAYKSGGKIGYSIILFKMENFKHLTGIKSELSANRFFEAACNGMLSEDNVVLADGNTHRKLFVLPMVSRMFSGSTLRGDFNRSGIRIEADYFVGNTAKRVAIGFKTGKFYDTPVTLYNEDIRKITRSTDKVICVWRRAKNEDGYSCVYCAKEYDAEALLEKWEAELVSPAI